jgi:hypothetical protein
LKQFVKKYDRKQNESKSKVTRRGLEEELREAAAI